MRKILLLLSVTLSSNLICHAQFSLNAEKLAVLDTIRNQSEIDKLNKSREQYFTADLFTVSKYKNQSGLMLIARKENYWLVYDMPFDNLSEKNIIKYNGKYFYYKTYFTHASRGNLIANESLNIIDPAKAIYFELQIMINQETYDPEIDSGRSVIKSCNCKIIMEQEMITSIQTNNNLSDCLGNGIYTIKNDKLVRHKFYDEKNYRMSEIRWAGKIATWMTLNEVKLIYPDASIEKITDRYSVCAEDERPAYLLKNDTDSLAVLFLDTEENYIQKIVVLSKSISFNKINSDLTIKEVLKYYPDAKLQTDLLSEYEYLYLQDLNIKIVFNTTEKNRIGKYQDEKMTKLLRPSAKIDYIEIN